MPAIPPIIAEAVRGYVLFDRCTLIEPDELRLRRADWPLWRRTLRPFGAVLWWLGGPVRAFLPASWSYVATPPVALGWAMTAALAMCVILGVTLEWHDRRREGRPIVTRLRYVLAIERMEAGLTRGRAAMPPEQEG